MKAIQHAISTCLVLLFTIFSTTAQQYSTVKITAPEDKRQRAELLGLLEVDHFDVRDGGIIAEINQEQIATLARSGYRYEILVPDIKMHIQELNRQYYAASSQARMAMEQPGTTVSNIIRVPAAFQVQASLGGFYSFAQMNTAMNNLVAAYPSLAQKISLGTSTQGRNIWCIKISDNVATDETGEPEVLYIGLQHAREAIGGSSMIFFMQYLCENYATDPRIQALVNNREFFIIPCMNPDGWEYNRTTDPSGGGGWRKNRRNNGDGTFGVDLNRNWGVDFGNCSGATSSCGSSNTSSDTYWGPAAFSEPETQAVRDFVLSHHIVSTLDQHSYGPYYSLPFGRPSLHTGVDSLSMLEQQYYTRVPAMMGKYNGMRSGNSIQSVGYEVAGGVKDWMLKGDIGTGTKGVIMGYTGEGGAGDGTGGSYGSFWPPASQIINLCRGMVFQNLQQAYAAGSYVDITDRSDIAVPTLSGAFDFRVKRVGLDNGPVTVTLLPIENIYSVGAPVTINSLPNYFDTYNGNISYVLNNGVQPGYRIKYAWRIQTGGQTYYDTVVKLFNPVQMITDDMETGVVSTKWTVGSNWNYTSSMAFTGSRSLTESPSGNYGANRNDVIRYNTTLDLSDATAAYLSFWVRHRAENFRDKLQVQVSPDGINWTAIAGRTTVQEPGTFDGSTIDGEPSLTGICEDWIPEQFDLSSMFGQSAVRIQFVFTSDANTTGYDFQVDEGFNIDNIKIVKSTTALVVLPVRFIKLAGEIKQNNSIDLNWEAITDADHDHFVVERSADGVSFTSIGTVASLPNKFTDMQPYAGINYYRVKSVSHNGQSAYSSVIHVVVKPGQWLVNVYPNPVREELNVRIKIFSAENLTLRVTDINGRMIIDREISPGEITSDIKINTAAWSPGFYLLKLVNSRKEILATQKIIRQ